MLLSMNLHGVHAVLNKFAWCWCCSEWIFMVWMVDLNYIFADAATPTPMVQMDLQRVKQEVSQQRLLHSDGWNGRGNGARRNQLWWRSGNKTTQRTSLMGSRRETCWTTSDSSTRSSSLESLWWITMMLILRLETFTYWSASYQPAPFSAMWWCIPTGTLCLA